MYFLKKIISLLTAILLVAAILPAPAFAAGAPSLQIAVISDPHYFLPEYISDTEAFSSATDDGRPLLAESEAIFDHYLDTVRAEKPDVLLIPGDLTGDGGRTAHEAVAKRLSALKNDLPDIKIYIINGNHDINRTDSRNYNTPDGIPVSVPSVTPDEFYEIYDFIYTDDSVIGRYAPPDGQRSGGLSYAARPCDGVTILVLDSSIYSADATSSGLDRAEGDGIISAALEDWVLKESASAHERGDTVIAMMHHNVVPHFSLEPVIYSEYIINDYEHVAAMLADAGISVVFTGHMHANDISAYRSASGNPLYDVMTSACVTYPSCMRFAELTNSGSETTLDIRTVHAENLDFTDPLTGSAKHIDDICEYGLPRGFKSGAVTLMLSDFLHKIVNRFITQDSEAKSWLISRLDGHLSSIVRQICDIEIDDEHTLLDAVNRVYFMMLAGEENGDYPDWVQSVLERTESGEMIRKIMDIVHHEAFGSCADGIRFRCIITASVESLLGKAVVRLADVLGCDSNYLHDNDTVLKLPNYNAETVNAVPNQRISLSAVLTSVRSFFRLVSEKLSQRIEARVTEFFRYRIGA